MTASPFACATALALLMLLTVGGCLSRSVPPRSYVLSPAAASPPPATSDKGPSVGVGPVAIPGYLDRSAVVVRAAGDEVKLSEAHHWAESLKDGVARVVAENLSTMIPTDAIVVFPWRTPWTVQYRVTLEILRFDGPLGGPIVLNARWRLLDATGKELALKAVARSEATTDTTYASVVSAQSRLLAHVSRDIADEIKARPR